MADGAVAPLISATLLVLAAGCFAAADSALGAASRARVDELVRARRAGAEHFAAVLADRPRHINLLLLLRLGCELGATVLVTVVAVRLIEPTWLAAAVSGLGMLVVSYVLVGVGPRTIGRQHPYRVGLVAALPVRVLAGLLNPLTKLLILIGNAITPGRGFPEGPFSSEVELRELVDMAQARGVVADEEREMIHSVFELRGTIAREVMVPRTELVWIEHDKTLRQALALCLRTGFSRIPVIGGSVDDIVGIAHFKDLVRAAQDGRSDSLGAEGPLIYRPVTFVPDTKRLDILLKEMQISRNHMAIVVDEYGGTAGLLTIEDIIEEIVGEITDEYDGDERPPVERLDGIGYRVSARLPIEDLGALYRLDLGEHDVETVGGLLAALLGRVPLPGAEAEHAGLHLVAEGGKDNRGRMRIRTVTVTKVEGEQR
jgi:CBS domain containing-hemolysin-like protein